jgi:hypothetical protein
MKKSIKGSHVSLVNCVCHRLTALIVVYLVKDFMDPVNLYK